MQGKQSPHKLLLAVPREPSPLGEAVKDPSLVTCSLSRWLSAALGKSVTPGRATRIQKHIHADTHTLPGEECPPADTQKDV